MPGSGMVSVFRSPTRKGTTLIELLIAISIAVVILAVTLSVYGVVNLSRHRQQDRQQHDTATALDIVRRDLAAVIQGAFSNAPPLEIELSSPLLGDRPPSSTLRVCVGVLAADEPLNRLTAAQVRYRVRPSAAPLSGDELVREQTPLTSIDGTSRCETNVLLNHVIAFSVDVLKGETWTNQWRHRPGHRPPRAADVRVSWTSGVSTQTASVLAPIPAGATF